MVAYATLFEKDSMYKSGFKRIMDLVLAFSAVVLLLPLLCGICLLLLLALRENPFFVQTRAGREGKLFKLIKFRTMRSHKSKHGELLPDEQRRTKFGWLLRTTSIDEIPQLINVLAGDMSLIGPRPLLPEYLPLYNQYQRRRHDVAPGITGWAQVNGRNSISWEEKFNYDVWYVENLSLLLDFKILAITIKKIFIVDKGSIDGVVPVQKFEGSPEV